MVRADPAGPYARAASTTFGRAVRHDRGVLEIGSGVGEWLLLGPIGAASSLVSNVRAGATGDFVTAIDLTDGLALMRLTGADAASVLAKVCAMDLDDEVAPNLTSFCSSVARVVTGVVRDDRDATRSYLLHCERAYGQYLFDALRDAGTEFGLEVLGFIDDERAAIV